MQGSREEHALGLSEKGIDLLHRAFPYHSDPKPGQLGIYLPLSAWKTRGFDTDLIKEKGDKKDCPVTGLDQ